MAENVTLDNRLGSALDPEHARMKANRAALTALLAEMRAEEEAIKQGGGAKAAEAQHAKGRLTVRERLKLLLDEGTEFLELGLWAAHGMYAEYGGAPCAGVVTGLGRVSGTIMHDCGQRRHCEGGRVFPNDGEESAARTDHRHGKSHSHALPGGFVGRFSAAAGGCISRYRRFRAHLSQQRSDELAGNPTDHGHHGHVRGGRGVSASDDGYRFDDRRIGFVSCRALAGAGGDRAEDWTRKSWAVRRCTRRFQGPWISRSRTIICAWRGCDRWWRRWASEAATAPERRRLPAP